MKTDSKRYHLIDSLRGCAIISMILYHFCYDVYVVFGRDPYWTYIDPVHWWQQSICCSFILISGISWHFIRRKWKQGLLLNFWGLMITLATLIALPSEAIWFGILTFIGCAVFCMTLLHPVACRVPAKTGVCFSLLFFLLTRHIARGNIGLFTWFEIPLPEWLYTPVLTTWIGFPHPGFVSSDYFPLLPWFFLYLTGYYLWHLIQSCPFVKDTTIPFVCTIGKKSLFLYVIHQPLCMAAAYLLSLFW